MNPLHLLGSYGKDNSNSILEVFKENIKDFDLNRKDAKGNSGKTFKIIELFSISIRIIFVFQHCYLLIKMEMVTCAEV